ncbi:MAG: hypothetical protein IJW32_05785, partial [Clostridia bacterium]|nr:hypothetical protein [Clostridia bacterium]
MSKILKLKQYYISHKFIINLVLLVCLFFASIFWQGMMWIVYPILLIMCLLDSLENGFSYILFCLPYLSIRPALSSILYFVCILAFIIKFYIIIYAVEKQKPNKWEVIFTLLFFIYAFLPIGPYNKNFFMKICMVVFLLVFISGFCKKSELIRLNFNIRLVALSLIVSCLMSVVHYILPCYEESFAALHRFKALLDNPNTLAMVCEILLSLLLYLIITNKKWQDVLLFIVVASLGVLTFSKTFILILAFLLIVMFCVFIKSKPKTTIGAILGCVAAVGLVYLIAP